jgi:hypothetical protein
MLEARRQAALRDQLDTQLQACGKEREVEGNSVHSELQPAR